MSTIELLQAIKRLPVEQRLRLVEQTLQSIREGEASRQLEQAAAALYADYATNQELTVFTNLDFDAFYEAR